VALPELDRAVRGTPQLQIAADGWWEHAKTAPLPLTPGGVDGLLDAFGATEVGVEVLWPGPPTVFVGARVGRVDRPLVREIATRWDWTPSQALEILARGPLGPPVRAELGAINAWRSVEPLHLRIDADASAIETALAGRTDLACCDRPVALEIVHETPQQAWWAIEVSSRRAGTHPVRVEQLAQVLRAAAERERSN
jgi:hypothetical protein